MLFLLSGVKCDLMRLCSTLPPFSVGYYVWLDVAVVNQYEPSTEHLDPASFSRLLNVIGRTLLVLDHEAEALTRLWCCYEVGLGIQELCLPPIP